jgi:type III secretory pathway lipoprotein EscJ
VQALRAVAILALAGSISACNEEILHDLSEREANKVLSHLSAVHLGAVKVPQADGRWAIAVDQDEMVLALSHLDTQRVLVTREGDSTVSKGSMIPSREEQRFRYERALAASIEESLAAIPGVLEPRVHINVPEDDPLFSSRDPHLGSGSVLLVVDESFRAHDDEISALVAGAAGIERQSVRVLRSTAPPPRRTLVELPARVVAPPTEIRAASTPPWAAAAVIGGGLVCVLGIRRLAARRKKRPTFSLPKELDFEG